MDSPSVKDQGHDQSGVAEADAKSPPPVRSDTLGILKVIPEKQRLMCLVFLIGETMLAGIYPLATPEAKNWAFGAIVAWPLAILIVATLLYLRDLSAVRSSLNAAKTSSGASTANSTRTAASTQGYDLFISAPMDALGNDESYRQNKDVILRIMQAFTQNAKMQSIYFGGAQLDTRAEFDDEARGYAAVHDALQAARHYVLIWPERVASSALFELGVAAQRRIPTVIFHRQGADLPYLLRGKLKSDLNDGWPVKSYDYSDLLSLKNTVQLAGTTLFPEEPEKH